MKHDVLRSVAHHIAVIAAAVFLATPDAAHSADDACSKLVQHEAVVVTDIQVGGEVYWNGAKVTPEQFDTYLREQAREQPNVIFHVTWKPAEEARAATLVQQIRSRGFEVAINCPPIPF